MNTKTEETIVKIFNDKILTPVLFMMEAENVVCLIGFFDRDLDDATVLETASSIYGETGLAAEIFDIREFSESERLDILNNASIVYSESELVRSIFVMSMVEDLNRMIYRREEMLSRYKEFKTPYLQ